MALRESISLSLLLLVSLAGSSETTLTLTPGSLCKRLAEIPESENTLIIRGEADMNDFITMQSLPEGIVNLDLSGLHIVASHLDKPYFGRVLFEGGILPDYALSTLKATSLRLPLSITGIGSGAFMASSIKELEIPASVARLEDYALASMPSLTRVYGGEGLTFIGKGAFSGSPKLETVSLEKSGITTLPEDCFAGCTSLSSLTFPSGLRKVETGAISATGLSEVDFSATNTDFDDFALSGAPALNTARLNPSGKVGEGLFLGNTALSSVEDFPADIPDYTFAGCTSLTESPLSIATGRIGKSALEQTAIDSIIICSQVRVFDSRALANVSGLRAIKTEGDRTFVPEVEDDTFAGLSPSDICLYVNEKEADMWREHPVWGLFDIRINKILSTTSVEDGKDINITTDSGGLLISASSPLREVMVCTTDGKLLVGARPDASGYHISHDVYGAEGIIVVTAATENSRTSVRLVTGTPHK